MAAERATYPVRIVTPEGIAFAGDVQMLVVTGTGGALGMLARHAPIVADLRMGSARVQLEDGTWRAWATSEGFAKVRDNNGLVVVEDAVDVASLDPAELDAQQAAAEQAIADAERGGDDEVYSVDVEAQHPRIAWIENQRQVRVRESTAAAH